MNALLSSLHLNLPDEAATARLAERLAQALATEDVSAQAAGGVVPNATRGVVPPAAGGVVHLSGPLGAGKTHFTRALLRALGHQGRVRSPSFTIMEPYPLPGFTVHHFDFYRFTGSEEWREAGFDELIGAQGTLSLIEWPEMAAQSLQQPDLLLRLDHAGDDQPDARSAALQAFSTRGQRWLQEMAGA